MSAAVAFAFGAGAMGVAGAWDLLAGPDPVPGSAAVRRVLRPVALARSAGREPSRRERSRLATLAAGCVLAAGWLAAGPWAGIALAVLAPAAVAAVLRRRRRAYRTRLAAAAAGAARALAASLAAGRTIRAAVGEAASTLDGPAAVELERAAAAIAAGDGTEAALLALRDRAGSPPWNGLVAGILLQRDAGGDLPGLLRDTADALEAADRADADARAATAQARFTALVVGGLPLLAVALSELASPGFVAGLLTNPISAVLVVMAALVQATAVAAVRRITRGLDTP